MKTFSKMAAELFKKYEQYYHFSLRLTVNGQSVYCGFDHPSRTQHRFVADGSDILLECSEPDTVYELKGIEIALFPFLNPSSEQRFAWMLEHAASSENIESFEKELVEKQVVLVMITGTKQLDSVKEIIQHFVSQKSISCILNQSLWVLMPEEDMEIFEAMRSSIETELFTKVQLFVSSPFQEIRNLKAHADEVNLIQRLIQTYEPACLLASPKDIWLLRLIDSLSESEKESVLRSLTQGELHDLDDELIHTAEVFMKNNLSISATARDLYVHRNTLIYRLDKLFQMTGLDIRQFTDAQKLCFVLKMMKK